MATEDAGRDDEQRELWPALRAIAAVLAATGTLLVGLAALAQLFGGESAQEITLLPVNEPGESAFVEGLVPPQLDTQREAFLEDVSPDLEAGSSDGVDSGPTVVRTSTAGFYLWEPATNICLVDDLESALAADPVMRTEWVSAININEVDVFLDGLVPLVLRVDIQVTHHEYVDEAAVAVQAVLERGTAVLVDRFGMPRVRCASGSPLLPPEALGTDVTYLGSPWPHFEPGSVVHVVAETRPLDILQAVDAETRTTIEIPLNSSSTDSTATSLTTTSLTATSSTTTSSTDPPTTPTTDPSTTPPTDAPTTPVTDPPTTPSPCDPSYPDVCIPPPPPKLSCDDVKPHVNFRVIGDDPHDFDGDGDGIGCELP